MVQIPHAAVGSLSRFRPLALSLLCAIGLTPFLSAQVVLNEISAVSSGRILRWDANGQPFVGAGRPWWSWNFNETGWRDGSAPIGFGITPLTTNVKTELSDISPSLYVRKFFTVSAPDAVSTGSLTLQIVID